MFPLASATASTRLPSRGFASDELERRPALKASAERITSAIVKGLSAMAGVTTTVEGTVFEFNTLALRDLLAMQRPGSVASAIECSGVTCTVLATLDATLVHGVVELFCGGSGAECCADELRSATLIDGQYAHIISTLAAAAFAADWKTFGVTAAKPLRIEGAPAPDICGVNISTVGLLTLTLTLFGQRGKLSLALPPAILALFEGEVSDAAAAPVVDAAWSLRLRREVQRAPIAIDVLLEAMPLSLRQISELAVGQVLALPLEAKARAVIVCEGRTLYRGEIGQEDDRYSIRVDEIVPPPASRVASGTVTKHPLHDLVKA